MISEQVKKLRKLANQWKHNDVAGYNLIFDACDTIEALSAKVRASYRPTVDCTGFMKWLKAEVLDEENWELNAVANGEIICRKFKKLGWLDVEDGYYVDARPTGKWIKSDILPNGWHCSHCDSPVMTDDIKEMLFCPNCGSYNGG